MPKKAKKKEEEVKGDLALFGPLVAVKQHGGVWLFYIMGLCECIAHPTGSAHSIIEVTHNPRTDELRAFAGLTTLFRDKTYLAMDEEQRAKRMLVLSKSLASAWIKTAAQAIIDRAKVLQHRIRTHERTH